MFFSIDSEKKKQNIYLKIKYIDQLNVRHYQLFR
jgi:hypothetical protein